MMRAPLGLLGWRLLTGALAPAAPLLLRQRAARGKEDWTRLNERLGVAGLARPPGRVIWIHGASVGESLSALPLIEKLQENASVLVTSGTVTSAAMMGQRLPKGALHQFVPLDTPGAAARFLDYWKPDAGLFVESDLWPNLITAAAARGVKLALINARISARSAERWGWARKSGAAILAAFDMVLA
ncbi:MAG TPA: glycosyltransferase N-terminal domain-containing protein, partial [Rhizomicrobium sp.]|nr:glycosyltransferase N-terminal domain-containing protein [Rhizomicrobium sp.]